jgi:hypothetical protein
MMGRLPTAALLASVAVGLGSCAGRTEAVPVAVPAPPQAPSRQAAIGPVLGADGRCTGPAPAVATAIEPGIGECELVRLKGKPPTDVLVGESGKGQREVQVLYSEPGGRELYLFVDNRLDRIVK